MQDRERENLAVDRAAEELAVQIGAEFRSNLPIELQLLDGRCVRATMVNISQGGMAIQVNEALPKVSVRVRFGLPGVTTQKFEARTVLVWTNKASAGLQFIHIEAHGRENFERWLNSLEAQLQFRVFATQPNHS